MLVPGKSPPGSASCPRALTPASSSTINKPIASASSSIQTPSIFTNKQWVVPPRPKPGRKLAADAPPTKRKAQNREAQRNFRERRAARVGELEEQMEQVTEENRSEVQQLNSQIWQLEAKIQRLDTELAREKQIRQEAQREVAGLRQAQLNFGSDVVVSLPPRYPSNSRSNVGTQSEPAFGCGQCRIDSRCECIESALEDISTADHDLEDSVKRPDSPFSTSQNKKARHSSNAAKSEEDDDMEIDFTPLRVPARPPPLTTLASSMSHTATAAPDPCGFCQEGTACLCAELAKDQRREHIDMEPELLPEASNPSGVSQNPFNNGPGTCAQCRSDPKSASFCRSLAAARSDQRPIINLSESKKKNSHPAPSAQGSNNTAITGVSLSCADAYTHLSRHPAYQRASENSGSWMPNLTTVPNTGMSAFEIEAASILSTLKHFDNSFSPET